MRMAYRSDIDGLRAVAVLSVLFFHVDISGFSGGFVGVDIFFVISGYLITSILIQELEEDKFSVARFYERRIRRIFPALFPVIGFTLIFGWLIIDPAGFMDLGESILATIFFSSNILFWSQSGYFDAPSLQKPLLHTWSLAVEEQYYIFFPLILLFVSRFLKKKYLQFMIIAFIVSFLSSVYGVYRLKIMGFYFMPPRAWELLLGSIIALQVMPVISSVSVRNIVSASGLMMIFFSIFFFRESMLFPGYNALLPVLGSGMIIYSGIGGDSVVSKLLGKKFFVFIGLISYSLYLWHWVVIVFYKYLLKYLFIQPFGFKDRLFVIVISFMISVFSWRFIERPFRGKNPLLPERASLFIAAFSIMAITSVVGYYIYKENGLSSRFSDIRIIYSSVKSDQLWAEYQKQCEWLKDLKKGNKPPLIGEKEISPNYVLWGDSHAHALLIALASKSIQYGLSGYDLTQSGSLPLLDKGYVVKGSSFYDKYNQDVFDFIKKHPSVKTVILAGAWPSGKNGEKSERYVSGNFNSSLVKSVQSIRLAGYNVVVVMDVPGNKQDPNMLLYVADRFGKVPEFHKIVDNKSKYDKRSEYINNALYALVKSKEIEIVHPENCLFDDAGRGMVEKDGYMLYSDHSHLSSYGSLRIAESFDDVFKKMKNTK